MNLGDELAPHGDRGVGLQPESGLQILDRSEQRDCLAFGNHAPSVRPMTLNVNTMTDGIATVCQMGKKLADRARAARLRAGFPKESDAAKAIGCGRTTVIRWETDADSIGSRYLLAAAKAYRVRPEWLTLETDEDGYPWTDKLTASSRPAERPAPSQPASQSARTSSFTLALQLAAEALDQQGLTLPPPKYNELVVLIADLLEGELPEAQVLTFARRAAGLARGSDGEEDSENKGAAR